MVDQESEKASRLRLIGIAVTVPLALFVPPLVGWWIGNWLDDHFKIFPICTVIMILLGTVSGAREFYRLIKKVQSGELR
jgi:F0F1-type ATP synthase assembly protein I